MSSAPIRVLLTAVTWLLLALVAVPGLVGATSFDSITVVASLPTANEVNLTPGQFTFTRSGSTGNLVVTYAVTGTALAGTRYAALPGTITIPDGSHSATVLVTPLAEATIEGGQTVDVSISTSPTYIVGNPSIAEVTINDKDLTGSIFVGRPVCFKPPVPPAGGSVYDPFNTAIFRVDFNSQAVTRRFTVDFAGTAVPGTKYTARIMVGQDAAPTLGSLYDIARRPVNSTLVGGVNLNPSGVASFGYPAGSTTLNLQLSRALTGLTGKFEVGDWFQLATDTATIYVITGLGTATGATPGDSIPVTISPSLAFQTLSATAVQTTIPLTTLSSVLNRQILDLSTTYRHVEFEVSPLVDGTVTGRETVTATLESSNDFALLNPTATTVSIADNNSVLQAQLTSNAVRGGAAGVVTIVASAPFLIDIPVPFIASGTAVYGTDYTIPGATANGTGAYGSVVLPAGKTSVVIPVTALATGTTGIQTATITLLNSLDYSLAGSGSSSLNPSATVNIADPTTPIQVTPSATAGGTTGGTGAAVRTLPTTSGNSSCGLGSGMGILGLALSTMILRRRRQS